MEGRNRQGNGATHQVDEERLEGRASASLFIFDSASDAPSEANEDVTEDVGMFHMFNCEV